MASLSENSLSSYAKGLLDLEKLRPVETISRQISLSERRITRALLDPIILLLMEPGNKTGYRIAKTLENTFGLRLSWGTLYPHLHQLERDGMISGRKKMSATTSHLGIEYSLTETGRQELRRIFPS